MTRSILQDWAMGLGLRHQGVLLGAVRGCDTAPRHDPSKLLSRSLRAEFLNAHVGDQSKARTFIQRVPPAELAERMKTFLDGCDQYPVHFVMHLIHAAEVIAYHHPSVSTSHLWREFYFKACRKLHLQPETPAMLQARLNADEEAFFKEQDTTIAAGEP